MPNLSKNFEKVFDELTCTCWLVSYCWISSRCSHQWWDLETIDVCSFTYISKRLFWDHEWQKLKFCKKCHYNILSFIHSMIGCSWREMKFRLQLTNNVCSLVRTRWVCLERISKVKLPVELYKRSKRMNVYMRSILWKVYQNKTLYHNCY